MSLLSRKKSLTERIPPEVLARARKAGVTSPNWYAGRLEEPLSPELIFDGGKVDDDLHRHLRELAEQSHPTPVRDTAAATIRRAQALGRTARRLLRPSHT